MEGSREMLLFEAEACADCVCGIVRKRNCECARGRWLLAGQFLDEPAEGGVRKLDDDQLRNDYHRLDTPFGFRIACAGTDRHREEECDESAESAFFAAPFRHLIRFREETAHEAFACFHDLLLQKNFKKQEGVKQDASPCAGNIIHPL